MSLVIEEVQTKLHAELQARVPQALYKQWFAGTEVLSCREGLVEIGVKNRFFKGWIETRYLTVAMEAATAALGTKTRVTVSVAPHLYGPFREEQERDKADAEHLELPEPVFAPQAVVPRVAGVGMELNPDFTFDSFVVGAANRLSHAVALRAVECPEEYGRVFFCGEHGVGKTHLLQAVCHSVRRTRPEATVVYVTCERFMADFVAAHAGNGLKEFRAAYRGCDVLVLDQMQVLGEGSKSATQGELLALVDELEAKGRQVFFAGTLGPGELTGVDLRLRDRLGAGFVDRLGMPDAGMRRELLLRKLSHRGVVLDDGVLDLLAGEVGGNVRRLEGVVTRLSALLGVGGMQPTLACVRMALEVSSGMGAGRVVLGWRDVVGVVGEEFGVAEEALLGRGRAAVLRRARGVAVLLCRKVLGMRWVELGGVFGGRSHATLINIVNGAPAELFGEGIEGRSVERILFRLGVNIKPSELVEKQGRLFE